jgi:hypothetical protein
MIGQSMLGVLLEESLKEVTTKCIEVFSISNDFDNSRALTASAAGFNHDRPCVQIRKIVPLIQNPRLKF